MAESEKVIRYPVIKVRLYPNREQTELLEKTFGSCRYLWNQMLADVQEFYAVTDIHYIPTPAKYKRSAPFLAEVDSQALCAVHQNLRKAFMDFFRAPKRYSYPQYKTKKAQKDSFTVYCRAYHRGPSIVLTDNGIRMPKIGCIKAKLHRKPECDWQLRSVTVSKTKSGKYFCSIVFRSEELKAPQIIPTKERTIGLNHSLLHFYVDSEGNSIDVPDSIRRTKGKRPDAAKVMPDGQWFKELCRTNAENTPFAGAYSQPAERLYTQGKPADNQRLGCCVCTGNGLGKTFSKGEGHERHGFWFWRVS